jgi:sRNA-binding regulator protein Hfq
VSKKPTEQKSADFFDLGLLKRAGSFKLVLQNGTTFDCQYIKGSQFHLLVETGGERLLIPKHSILFFVLPSEGIT